MLTSLRPQTTVLSCFKRHKSLALVTCWWKELCQVTRDETRYEIGPAYAGVLRCLPAKSLSRSPGGRETWRTI